MSAFIVLAVVFTLTAAQGPVEPATWIGDRTKRHSPVDRKVELAREVSAAIHPADLAIRFEEPRWEMGIRIMLSRDNRIAELKRTHPGITEEIVASARPITEEYLRQQLVPKANAVRAEFFARELTLAELMLAGNYYRSEVGRRSVQYNYAELDTREALAAAVEREKKTGKFEVTKTDILHSISNAGQRLVPQSPLDDLPASGAWYLSAEGKRFQQISDAAELALRSKSDDWARDLHRRRTTIIEATIRRYSAGMPVGREK